MKQKIWIGIDPSLRGSGLVAIDEQDEIVEMLRIAPPPALFNDEELIDIIGEMTYEWFSRLFKNYDIVHTGIERIAYGGTTGSKDKIAAGWWEMRRSIKSVYKSNRESYRWPPEIIACNTWRAKVINKADRDANKENPDKLFLKNCPFEKLPAGVRDAIEEYTANMTKYAHHDLSDAYWIAYYVKKYC